MKKLFGTILPNIYRWFLRPLAIVVLLLGSIGYAYTVYQMLPLRTDDSVANGRVLPWSIHIDIWRLERGLTQYLEFVQTGVVQRQLYVRDTTVAEVPILVESAEYSGRRRSDGEIYVYVHKEYRDIPPEALKDIVASLSRLSDFTEVLARRANILLEFLQYAGAVLVAAGMLRLFRYLRGKYWTAEKSDRVRQKWMLITSNWRRVLLLVSILWGVIATLVVNPTESAEFAFVFGPFAISMAIYLLFPLRRAS